MAIEFIQLSGPSTTEIGGVNLEGTVELQEQGGQQAPEKKTDEGYTWTTRVGAEPLVVTVTAYTDSADYAALASLRAERSPIRFESAGASIDTAVIDDLRPTVTGSEPDTYNTTITVRQVQQGSLVTQGLGAFASSGPQYSGGGASSGSPNRETSSFDAGN